MRSAASLLEELRAVDESHSIEAKRASRIDRSVLETICAFANEPGQGGGFLLLGVAVSQQRDLFGRSYEVVGVPDPDQIQSDLASQCASAFNRPVRPTIAVELLEDAPVLVVFVPEAAPTDKPLYLTALGLPRGAFRRVGSTDQHGTEDDLITLYQGHQGEAYDSTLVADADLSDLDADAIALYRELRAQANPVAEELVWTDADLLRALGAVTPHEGALRPTVAGLLLFGTTMALRRYFPMMRIDYIRIPGREWVQDPDRRFDTVEIRAPLILAARRAIAAIRDDLPTSFSLPEGEALRRDETILPVRVIREAVVNAVMHRSYRIHGAIQILRYANRLEIRNPGHSLKAEQQLGEPGSEARNPHIAAVLHEVQLAETKGSGIRAMRELMTAQDLVPPTFESSRSPDQFVATFLFHHFLTEADLEWLGSLTTERLTDEEARALVFVREVGAIDNAAYRAINRVGTLEASAYLRRIRDLDLLTMRGSGSRTYYVPGPGFQWSDPPSRGPEPTSAVEIRMATDEVHMATDEVHMATDEVHMATEKSPLPPGLEARLPDPGRRLRKADLRSLIVDLCTHAPRSAGELASLLGGRDPSSLVRSHLRPMLDEGRLRYTIPEMPRHPDQKYSAPDPR